MICGGALALVLGVDVWGARAAQRRSTEIYDNATRAIELVEDMRWIRLANPAGALRPNAHAQVRFASHAANVTVPSAAVLSDGAQSYVYTVRDVGTIERRVVVAGAPMSGTTPILSGLTTSDRVVVQGTILLDNEIHLRAE